MEYYWLFVLICLVIHIVGNIDIFRRKSTVSLPAIKVYRVFVVSIGLYFIVDMLWGIFDELNLATALYIDTFVYFVVMGFTILCWARYIVRYLEGNKVFSKIMLYTGNTFFLAEIVLLIINFFVPILFTVTKVDGDVLYEAFRARRIMLYVQILIYFLLIIYTVIMAARKKSSLRRRYLAISSFSLIMATCITIQIYYPYLPLYSIGCVIGSVLLNSFVINDIKEEYKSALEKTRIEVKQGQIELNETKLIAYSDPLTGIKNKHAYVEKEEEIDKLISIGKMRDFAVVVFDLNGLKHINDTKGHDAGDVYIIDSCRTIEKYFGKDSLYRFGGDEFVAVLSGEAYKNRSQTLSEFERFIDSCLDTDLPIISSGMSKYRKGADNTYHAVFYRADKMMYSRKEMLKEHQK